jgi:geranylgeranyl diphosphate/geranylgeranyl-bacteriochlorophyllide a reductase
MAIQLPTAIVGGGPAGALAGERLARGKRDVVLFDEKLAWEKPCGGGITHKALTEYPFLAEGPHNPISHCELISPVGLRVRFHMQHPVAMFSRFALNELLLERARVAGVELHQARVTRIAREDGTWRITTPNGEYRAGQLILAVGARNPFRAQFLSPISSDDLQVTAGYFIPGRSSVMQIQFLKGITGYIWVFPRLDHVSAGITGKMGESSTAALRRMLERWLEANNYSLEGARFYSHILPALRSRTLETLKVCGEGWAAVGDSAGLVDPITGEGLYYALRSADLCAQAVLVGRQEEYQTRLEKEILPELRLAARVSQCFYSGQVFGESVLERMVSLTSQSESFRTLMSDLFAGIQGYRDLRSRLYRSLPALMAEGFSGALRLPWSGSGLTTDSFAE